MWKNVFSSVDLESKNKFSSFIYSASQLKGNIVNWNNAKWNITNLLASSITEKYLCKSESMGPVLIPERLNATGMLNLCQQLNGKVFLMKDNESLQKVMQLRIVGGVLDISQHTHPKCDGKIFFFNTVSAVLDPTLE